MTPEKAHTILIPKTKNNQLESPIFIFVFANFQTQSHLLRPTPTSDNHHHHPPMLVTHRTLASHPQPQVCQLFSLILFLLPFCLFLTLWLLLLNFCFKLLPLACSNFSLVFFFFCFFFFFFLVGYLSANL